MITRSTTVPLRSAVWKGPVLRHRVFFWGALVFLSSASFAQESSHWNQALEYLSKERDSPALERLTQRLLIERGQEFPLLRKRLEIEVARKDRKSLTELFYRILLANQCVSPREQVQTGEEIPTGNALHTLPRSRTCRQLFDLWDQSLSQLYFFETSAPRLEQARRFVVKGECSEALSPLKEVESQEGDLSKLLDAYEEVYECLKDNNALQEIEQRRAKMRFR